MPRKTDSSNPRDWVEVAEADLSLVRLGAAGEVSFGPCRAKLAEALEKSLKAERIRLAWPLEKTHDLQRLATLLRAKGSDIAAAAQPLANELTEAYFSDRYPGFDLDDPDWPALRLQIEAVGKLLETVKARVTPKMSVSAVFDGGLIKITDAFPRLLNLEFPEIGFFAFLLLQQDGPEKVF